MSTTPSWPTRSPASRSSRWPGSTSLIVPSSMTVLRPEDDETTGRAGRLCAWVDRNLDRFTPWHADGETTPSSLQRFAELAIAYDVVTGSPLPLSSPEDSWHSFILEHVRRPAFAELARSHLDLAWALLLPYLVLRGREDVDDYHDATLLASQRAGFPRALEVVPYRALDYAYFARRSGLSAVGDDQISTLL